MSTPVIPSEVPAAPPLGAGAASAVVSTLAANQSPPDSPPARRRRHLRGVPRSAEGLLFIDEAAERLRCSAKTVRKLVKTGALPFVRFTNSPTEAIRFRALDIARYIEDHTRRHEPKGGQQ